MSERWNRPFTLQSCCNVLGSCSANPGLKQSCLPHFWVWAACLHFRMPRSCSHVLIFSLCVWLAKMTQNRIHGHIIASSNSEHNYTLDTVTLSGRWLRSKSIRLCFEWNWTDWLIYVCQVKGKEMDTKKLQSVRERAGGGESQLYGWSAGLWWGKERIEPDRDKWSVRDKEI